VVGTARILVYAPWILLRWEEDDGAPPALSPRRSWPVSRAFAATFCCELVANLLPKQRAGWRETAADRTVEIKCIQRFPTRRLFSKHPPGDCQRSPTRNCLGHRWIFHPRRDIFPDFVCFANCRSTKNN
jgi:hypothetical protein